VFVSYRREDVPDAAHWIVRELEHRYGKGNVFLDVDKISPGRPYATVIAEWVEQADVFVAVIGPGWLGAETAGVRRIKRPEDFIRREVEIAVQAGKPVIPLLFENAAVPEVEDLPESLASLPDVQALHVTREHFDADVARLEHAIDEIVGQPAKPRRRLGAHAAWIGALAVALVAVGVVLATKSSPKPSSNTAPAQVGTKTTAPAAATSTTPGSSQVPKPSSNTVRAQPGTKTTAPAAATTTSTTSHSSQPGPDQIVSSYWSYIDHRQFSPAWGLLDSNAKAETKQSEQQFVESHESEGVTSASFSGRSSGEGESARVDVSSLTTEDHVNGCLRWEGYYVMKAEEGRWLIDQAHIESKAC
jgi:hypothetical protein